MEETILQNDLVREALYWYCAHLEKIEKLEFSKASRSITEEAFEKHDVAYCLCVEKRRVCEKMLFPDDVIVLHEDLIREALRSYCKNLIKSSLLELKKAMRAIDGESIEFHNAVSLRCQEKFVEIQDLFNMQNS